MDESLQTQPSLLIRMRDPRDSRAWSRFVEVYTPFIYNICRRRGLQPADAADVAQDVMQTLVREMPRFEYSRRAGAFRSWLFTVTRTRLCDACRKFERQPVGSGATEVHDLLQQQPDDHEEDWDASWRRHLLECAAERIRGEFEPPTWKSFWETSVQGRSVREVAQELDLTPGAIYIARSRVTNRLREAVKEIDDDAAAE